MKLIFCKSCCDIVKLDKVRRTCKCGNCYGWYHDDGLHATISKDAIAIGINNYILVGRIREGSGGNIAAWIFDETAANIEREQ